MGKRISVRDIEYNTFIELIRRFHIKPKTILDIGANDGVESKKLATSFPNSEVYAFEPVENIIKGGCKNLHPQKIVVGDIDGEVTFFCNKNSKLSSLFSSKYFDSIPVKKTMTRIDTWAKQRNIGKIDAVWIDVQQGELKVFEGFGDLLKEVSIIYTEVCYNSYYKGGVTYKDLQLFLRSKGFMMIRNIPNIDSPHGNAIFLNRKLLNWKSFYEMWWNEIYTKSTRDQISHPYVMHKTNIDFSIIPLNIYEIIEYRRSVKGTFKTYNHMRVKKN